MLLPAIVLTALALAAVLYFWRQGHVDPAEFDRRAQEKEKKATPGQPVTRARPPGSPRNRQARQNSRPTSRPDPASDEENAG